MLKKLILFSFIALSKLVVCQTPVYFTLGEKEFANSDIYTLFYDENTDIIYVGTNNGLYVYKQNEFLLLDRPEGQIGNSFFAIKQNSLGEVFCKNLNGQIFIIDEQKNSYDIFYSLSKNDGGENWYFFTEENDFLLVSKNKILLNPHNGGEVLLDCSNNGQSSISNSKQIGQEVFIHQNDNKNKLALIYRFTNSKFELFDSINGANLEYEDYMKIKYFSSSKGKIFYMNLAGEVSSQGDNIIQKTSVLKQERYDYLNDSVFIGLNSQKGYRYFYLNQDTLTSSTILFPNIFISTLTIANNGVYLLGTFGGGILVAPNPKIITNKYDYLFLGISCSPTNEVVLSTRSGEVFLVENSKMKLLDKAQINIDNVWYLTNYKPEPKIVYDNTINSLLGMRDIKVINENVLLYVNGTSVYVRIVDQNIDKKNLYIRYKHQKIDYTIASTERYIGVEWNRRDSLLYYSTNFGVYSRGWSDSIVNTYLFNNEQFQSNDLLVNNDELICATTMLGVLFFKGDKVVAQLSESQGLKSNSVKQIYIRNELLLILSKGGFQVFNLKTKYFLDIGISQGIILGDVTKFAVSDDKIWFLEKHAYYSAEISDLTKNNSKSIMPNLYMDSICVNGQKTNPNTQNVFDYTQNRFEFYYDYREIITKEETEIFYTLNGFYNEWKSISVFENRIEFQSLPPGNYDFKIYAQRRSEKTDMFVYSFKISPPFWQTWWFYVLIGVSIILVVTIYFTNRIKKIKEADLIQLEKQKLLTETIDFKLKALRSQMNPHFIFNSLNSIQALILKQETEKSYDYVVMFSDLVRKTLQYSEKDFIDIDDELEFLETYLSLESLRMKSDFTFNIKYNGDTGIQIPSLMVQPFVENAIHHGLLHKTGSKNVDILFEFNEEMKCTVTDNGIGRRAAKEINQRQNAKHKSFSLEATKQRMNIIEGKHGESFGYKFYDLIENKKSVGTKVVLFMPYKFKY